MPAFFYPQISWWGRFASWLFFRGRIGLIGPIRPINQTDPSDRSDRTEKRREEKTHAKARRREEDKCEDEWRHVLPLCGNSRRRY